MSKREFKTHLIESEPPDMSQVFLLIADKLKKGKRHIEK